MTLNELKVSIRLKFPTLSLTVNVQSEYVPLLKETKVIVLFPLIAEVVFEEQDPLVRQTAQEHPQVLIIPEGLLQMEQTYMWQIMAIT